MTIKLGLLAEQTKLAMSSGYLDLLCILSQEEVEEFGMTDGNTHVPQSIPISISRNVYYDINGMVVIY